MAIVATLALALSVSLLALAASSGTLPPRPTTRPSTTTTTTPSGGALLTTYYQKWANGPDPSGTPTYLPIGVWDQGADRGENGVPNPVAYKNLGINVDVGGYDGVKGLTDASGFVTYNWDVWAQPGPHTPSGPYRQITYNQSHLTFGARVTGSELADEPDMNRTNCNPPCAEDNPLGIQSEGKAVRSADPTRPVYVNFGKPASLQSWRGYYYPTQTGSWASDFATYCSGVDILSSDIYAYTTTDSLITHGAWEYGRTVDYVRTWCPNKPYYGFVETGHPFSNGGTITPAQIQAAVWDSMMHGANGIIYFVHDFDTNGFTEDGLLTTEAAAQPTVKAVDTELAALAPELNSPSQPGVVVNSTTRGVPITTMLKSVGGHTWLFAMADGNANMIGSGNTTATLTVPGGFSGSASVYSENRTVPVSTGRLTDHFTPYQVHVYQVG